MVENKTFPQKQCLLALILGDTWNGSTSNVDVIYTERDTFRDGSTVWSIAGAWSCDPLSAPWITHRHTVPCPWRGLHNWQLSLADRCGDSHERHKFHLSAGRKSKSATLASGAPAELAAQWNMTTLSKHRKSGNISFSVLLSFPLFSSLVLV